MTRQLAFNVDISLGFYTSSNDLEEEDSPPQRGRGRQRRPPANFEDDDAGFGNEDPPSSYNRTPRLPPPHSHPGRPEDDYEDGPPQYDQGQRNNQYNGTVVHSPLWVEHNYQLAHYPDR